MSVIGRSLPLKTVHIVAQKRKNRQNVGKKPPLEGKFLKLNTWEYLGASVGVSIAIYGTIKAIGWLLAPFTGGASAIATETGTNIAIAAQSSLQATLNATMVASQMVGQIGLDAITGNIVDEDGNFSWTTLFLDTVPVLGPEMLGKGLRGIDKIKTSKKITKIIDGMAKENLFANAKGVGGFTQKQLTKILTNKKTLNDWKAFKMGKMGQKMGMGVKGMRKLQRQNRFRGTINGWHKKAVLDKYAKERMIKNVGDILKNSPWGSITKENMAKIGELIKVANKVYNKYDEMVHMKYFKQLFRTQTKVGAFKKLYEFANYKGDMKNFGTYMFSMGRKVYEELNSFTTAGMLLRNSMRALHYTAKWARVLDPIYAFRKVGDLAWKVITRTRVRAGIYEEFITEGWRRVWKRTDIVREQMIVKRGKLVKNQAGEVIVDHMKREIFNNQNFTKTIEKWRVEKNLYKPNFKGEKTIMERYDRYTRSAEVQQWYKSERYKTISNNGRVPEYDWNKVLGSDGKIKNLIGMDKANFYKVNKQGQIKSKGYWEDRNWYKRVKKWKQVVKMKVRDWFENLLMKSKLDYKDMLKQMRLAIPVDSGWVSSYQILPMSFGVSMKIGFYDLKVSKQKKPIYTGPLDEITLKSWQLNAQPYDSYGKFYLETFAYGRKDWTSFIANIGGPELNGSLTHQLAWSAFRLYRDGQAMPRTFKKWQKVGDINMRSTTWNTFGNKTIRNTFSLIPFGNYASRLIAVGANSAVNGKGWNWAGALSIIGSHGAHIVNRVRRKDIVVNTKQDLVKNNSKKGFEFYKYNELKGVDELQVNQVYSKKRLDPEPKPFSRYAWYGEKQKRAKRAARRK